jgi:hypothetical protein
MNLQELVEKYPNDQELGEKVREIYWNNRKAMEQYKDLVVYESPDGGKTVYQRPFGGDISERTLV